MRALASVARAGASLRSVDASRVYLVGFSMGAIGLWDLVARHPELFAAAVPVSGDLEVTSAQALRDFPLWAFHGERDDVVPNTATRAMFAAMQREGGLARYTEFPGVGHEAWQPAFAKRELYEWLFAQRQTG